MGTPAEGHVVKIQALEDGQAEFWAEMSKLDCMFTESDYLNILQSMGQAVHILGLDGRVFYWIRRDVDVSCGNKISTLRSDSAENLYGYTSAEAVGRDICELLVSYRDAAVAEIIVQRCITGQTWTGQFPVIHKTGRKLTVIATNTPFYDDDGTLIGSICVSCDSRPFKDCQISISDPEEDEMSQDFSRPRNSLMARLCLCAHQPLRTVIASKITNLVSKVRNYVRSKTKIRESNLFRENKMGGSRPGTHGTPVRVVASFTTGKSTGTKVMQWSSKGTEHEPTDETQSGQFDWPSKQSEEDFNQAYSAVKSEIPTSSDYNRPFANEASGSLLSYYFNSSSSSCSCRSSSSSSVTHKLDAEIDWLNYEIIWEDLTVGKQIGEGSCGTVYHGLWYGSDVAVKVFSKEDYSQEVTFCFQQEVSLMKQLRHPNILLFMGAVTSPQLLCIITEFLPRGNLFRLLRRKTSKLDWRRRIHMALDIARGMNYLHSRNPPIVHCDLTSSNLLVDKNWSVKVADFGLSRVKQETYLTARNAKGTPQWMAPEVLRNEPSNEKSDLYSFGVILWELATQKIPWENLNAMQVIGAVGFLNERLDIPEDVDPAWGALIESCWRSEPQSRPTFQEVLVELKDMKKRYSEQSKAARAASADASLRKV